MVERGLRIDGAEGSTRGLEIGVSMMDEDRITDRLIELAITIAIIFFLTMYCFVIPSVMNDRRLGDARQIAGALAAYRNDHGGFPISAGTLIAGLEPELVTGGYIAKLPTEPLSAWRRGVDYSYRSPGPQYGLRVPLQTVGLFELWDHACMIGNYEAASAYWGNPPQCPSRSDSSTTPSSALED